MAVTSYYPGTAPVFMGLSTDTKPANAPPGSKFIETDDAKVYLLLNTGVWTQIGVIAATPDLSVAATI